MEDLGKEKKLHTSKVGRKKTISKKIKHRTKHSTKHKGAKKR
jgi:hypothetical protein